MRGAMRANVLLVSAAVACGTAFGAVGNVQVRGVTATQAVITYSAPDTNPCQVEVSESPTYSPLVHDVDSSLFAGANLDSRAESLRSGPQRVFVTGKRRAEKALNGHWYSRAMQALTTHYFRITCGASVAKGQFVTANIALGSSYNEALPADPAVSARSYYSVTGSYAWPEFLNWNRQDPTARPESVIDPQTGMLLKRLAMPQDDPISWLPGAGDHAFFSALSADGAWHMATTVWSAGNGKLVSIVVGAGSATVNTSVAHGLQAGAVVAISGSAAGGNGSYQISSVPTATSFQIPRSSLPASTTLQGGALAVTAGAITANNGTAATFSGAGSNLLFLRDPTYWPGSGTNLFDITLPTEFIVLSLSGWCAGTCAGEDTKLQACITINGVSCWPSNATAKYQEGALGTSATNNFTAFGTSVPILDSWTPAGYAPLTRADISTRMGYANVDASGNVTWQSGGYPNTYFNPNWTAGSRITIGGAECTIVSVQGLTAMSINPASCSTALSLPLTGTTFSGSNFGFLVRKKTASLDQINLQAAKYTTGTSEYMGFTSSGSEQLCSQTLTQNSVTGGLGYHCIMSSDWPMLYWVDHKTGDATYLGEFNRAGVSGPDGFAGGYCDGARTLGGTTPTVPENFYCTATDNETTAKQIIIGCKLSSTNQPGNQSVSCTNLTPGTLGKDILSLVAQFSANDSVPFDATKYSCAVAGRQGNKLVLGCGRSIQNSLGWTVMFDPFAVGTTPGCVGGGAAGCVVAAANTWTNAPARWCVSHTRFIAGNTSTLWIAGDPFFGYSPATYPDVGPYTTTIVSATLTATPGIAAGTGACPSGSAGCNVVTVDGEPCNMTPAPGEASGSAVCPKNSSWAYLQDTKVGDVLNLEGEYMLLLAKNGTQWTLQRGYGPTSIAGHSSGAMRTQCLAHDFTNPAVNYSWTWDTIRDPHGTNSDGTTVLVAWDYDHPVPRPDVTLGGLPWYDSKCAQDRNACYAARDHTGSIGDAPNRRVALSPPFSGAIGTGQSISRAQDHPSWLQDNASPVERQWFLDGRPLAPFVDTSDAAISVSGQLYKLTSTTTDGDNLYRLGYNVYTVKNSATQLTVAGNCSAANPCPNWDSGGTLVDSITQSCTITLVSGSGTIYIADLNGAVVVTRPSGMTVTTDTCAILTGTTFASGATTLWAWTATAGTWAAAGSDSRGGYSGYISGLNRKVQPTWAYCGMQPLVDVSSGATGNVISDTGTDSYKYCVARKAGECRTNSGAGDIFVNCPNVVPRMGGSYGCMWYQANQDVPVDICIGNMSANLNSISQFGYKQNDFAGALARTLTHGLTRYKIIDDFWHGKAVSDASWLLFRSMYTNGAWTEILLGKVPPYPATDSVTRSNFQAIPIQLKPPAGLGVDNAVIQFGYAENGAPDNFYCTSRQEKCLANSGSVPTPPLAATNPTPAFSFPTDGTGGLETGVTGMACSTGCTIVIPAISQRMLYYQVKYRDVSNHTKATGRVEVVNVP